MFVVALEIFQEVIRYEGWKQNLMSSGHQKPCVVLRLGSPFLLGWLYRMTLYLMVGAELFFLDTIELSFIQCFHRDHSSKYQKITGGMVVFVFG